MDLMPIQSVSTEPAPPTEDVDAADLTGFGEMIAALLAESGVGQARETSSKSQSGIDPDTGREASDPPLTEPGNTAAPPAEDGPPALHQPATLAIARGPNESPNTGAKTTVAVTPPDMARQPDASDPTSDTAAPSATATDETGGGKHTGSVPSIPEHDSSHGRANRGISSAASTPHQPAEGRGNGALAPIEAPDAADVLTTASHSGPTVSSATAATTSSTADSGAPVTKPFINTDRNLAPNPATGDEPATEGHEPGPRPPTPETNAERPSPTPKLDMQMPEISGEVAARAPEAPVEVERAAMAEVVDRLREWADRVDSARQPDSISLKLADPDGEVLIRLVMRDGRLELNVTRPGGETPAWLADQLDDALARHGFDLSGGDPEAGHTDARWGGGSHKPDRRSGSQARRHQPDQAEGLWI